MLSKFTGRMLFTRLLSLVVIVIVFSLLAQRVGSPLVVYANGGPDTRQILESHLSSYYLVVSATPGRPRVGIVHLTISLMEIERVNAITGARIELIATPPVDSTATEASYAVPSSSLNPQNYDINVPLDVPGQWSFTILIEGSLGQEQTTFNVEVREASNNTISILYFILAFLTLPVALVAVWGWSRWSRRRKVGSGL